MTRTRNNKDFAVALEHLTNELRDHRTETKEHREETKENFKELRGDVKVIKEDVHSLKAEVAVIKAQRETTKDVKRDYRALGFSVVSTVVALAAVVVAYFRH